MAHRTMTAPLRGALTLTLVAMLATALAGGAAAAPPATKEAAAPAAPVDLNTATAEELQTVRGIGAALARRIVEFRDQHGPFERVDDLLKIRGIGEKSLEKLRPHVRVEKRR